MTKLLKDIELTQLPSLNKGYLKAASQLISKSIIVKHGGNALPSLPNKRFVLKNFQINQDEVRKYTENTKLNFDNVLPITYLYSVAFPIVIKLLTESDFPYVPVGLVHLYNTINQYQPVAVDATVDIYVHSTNLREHRSGILVDVVTEVYVAQDLVWSQISTMLKKQKTSLSGTLREQSAAFDKSKVTGEEIIKASAATIKKYASISGDKNPIHMSPITAKLFGFPQMIAHGSWMMARILSTTAQQLPKACTYSIEFGKPFLVPGSAKLFVAETEAEHRSYSLENTEKDIVILKAQVVPLQK